jgi:hypothetical protein
MRNDETEIHDTFAHLDLANHLIVSAPLASSGDIYHVAAVLILLKSLEKKLPTVLLTYDTKPTDDGKAVPSNVKHVKTYHHAVQRSAGFLKGLGFGKQCETRDIGGDVKAYYVTTREAALVSFLRQDFPARSYVDQRSCTGIISWHIRETKFENTTSILRDGFKRWENEDYFSKGDVLNIKKYSNDAINGITKKFENRPFVVIQIRQSSGQGANNEHHVGVILLYADSRVAGNTGYSDCLYFKPFSSKSNKEMLSAEQQDSETQKDLAKFFHLQLLLKLFELPNCKGIIGNTSGTLDIAAFIGHKVFNIHHLDPEKKIDYQDYRLFMQMVFLAIQLRFEWERYGDKSDPNQENALLINLLKWINTGEKPCLPKKSLPAGASLTCFSSVKSSTAAPRELPFWQNLKAETDRSFESLTIKSAL